MGFPHNRCFNLICYSKNLCTIYLSLRIIHLCTFLPNLKLGPIQLMQYYLLSATFSPLSFKIISCYAHWPLVQFPSLSLVCNPFDRWESKLLLSAYYSLKLSAPELCNAILYSIFSINHTSKTCIQSWKKYYCYY